MNGGANSGAAGLERGGRRWLDAGRRWLERSIVAVAVAVSAGLFVPGVVLGARWWTSVPDAVGVVPVALCFVVGWRVGGALSVLGLVALSFGSSTGDLSDSVVSMWVFTIPAWIAGVVMRSRSFLSAQLAQRAHELEQEREAFARESVRYERARIARDLHDIVAHNLSVIVVQAAAGRRALAEHPEIASDSLRHIEGAAHSAGAEMDQLVGLLADEPAAAPTGDGLRALDDLLRRAAASGLSIKYSIAVEHEPVRSAVAEVAYRVAQEGITNALKHAPGAEISVEAKVDDERLSVAVENGAPRAGGHPLAKLGGGFGLAGLRERIAALGGSLEAEPTAAGGWRLAAGLPVGERRGSGAAGRVAPGPRVARPHD